MFPRADSGDFLSLSTRHPWRASYFLLRGQEKVSKEKATPTLAPCAQSLCSRCASALRGSLTVHPWTGIELAHVVWAILRTVPTHARRDRGDPMSAHRARQRNSQSSAPCASSHEPALSLPRTMRAHRVPSIAASVRRRSPQDGPHDVGQFDASPWMDCQRTPQHARAPGAQGLCARRECGGGLSLGYFSLATQREVTRSPGGE